MIKLLLILTLFIPIFGTEKLYHLPNNHSALLHHISSFFKNGQNIVILSPSFNHAELKKQLENRGKKGGHITLILNNADGYPLSMIQYQNIDLIVSPVQLHHSVILVDEKIVCAMDGKLDEEDMTSYPHIFRCSEKSDAINTQHRLAERLVKKGKMYLE